jgi:hypothetical protein
MNASLWKRGVGLDEKEFWEISIKTTFHMLSMCIYTMLVPCTTVIMTDDHMSCYAPLLWSSKRHFGALRKKRRPNHHFVLKNEYGMRCSILG